MTTFFSEMITALRTVDSSIPITVGQASVKWSKAFLSLGLDYYQHHYYDWMEPFYPIAAPMSSDYVGTPTVMGEFPIGGAAVATVTEMINTWRGTGHLAVYGWDYRPTSPTTLSGRNAGLDEMLAWRMANPL